MAKNTNRDEFSEKTKRLLERQAGSHCSNPSCRRLTSGANADGTDVIRIGEAAHITAAAPGGPRYDANLTSEERKSAENGIWLCRVHAKAIDSRDPSFSVELLRDWKRQSNEATLRSITENAPFPELSPPPTDEEARSRLRMAAADDLAVFRRTEEWPSSTVPLTLRIGQISEHLGTGALARAVITYGDLVLVAGPGMGKTTTIFQIAAGVANAQDAAPIVVPLGAWATLRVGLLESVLRRPAYSGVSEADLRKAAATPGVVLLLDGWNELDATSRARARVEIARLKAELPELGLVVSTRRQATDIPIAGTRVDLLPLSDQQHMEIAKERRGEAGERLLDHARRTPGIRELVPIPLYLTSLLALPDGKPFPTTKEEVLRLFVSALERDAGKRATLEDATEGFPASYLESLAAYMTVNSNTFIRDVEARQVVTGVTQELLESGQLATVKTQPDGLLDALVSAHVLVRSEDVAGLSFQHQQFQEWFASQEVERLMLAAEGDPAALERLRADVLNCRTWTEAILFAVDRTARGDDAQRRACAAAVLAGFDIDPLLAAEMIFRAGDEVWNHVADEIQSRVGRWHAPGKLDRAFGFMISTGRPEFVDILWPQLAHENDQVHLGALRAAERFRPSVLGEDATGRLANLPTPVRRNVLSEMVHNSGIEGLDLATAVAIDDPDSDVVAGVANSLALRGADRHLFKLLCNAEEAVYDRLARNSRVVEIDDAEVRARLAAARERQMASGMSPRDRLRSLLWEGPSKEAPREIVELVTDLDIDGREDDDRRLLWELNYHHPNAIAEAVLNRLRAGRALFHGADDILAAAGLTIEDDDLLKVALAETGPHDDKAEAAASVLGPNAVGAMVDAFLDVRSRLRNANGGIDQAANDRIHSLRQRLDHAQGACLVTAVAARSNAVQNEELATLASLFSRQAWAASGRERPFGTEALEIIGSLAQDWANRLLADHGTSRYEKAEIARMIGHAPTVTLLPTLQRLLDDNLKRYHEFRRAAKASRWRDDAAVNEARQPHMNEYEAAMTAIQAPETFEVAAGYLTSEHFCESAARVLAVQWTDRNEPREDRWLAGGVDFSRVSARRAARLAKPDESCLEADAIFAAVETLIADGTTDEQRMRAVVLGSVGARLPHGNRAEIFERLIAFGPRQSRAALFLGLVLSGEHVSIDLVADGIDETLDEAKTKPWILTDGEGYQLRDWLRLLPFATPITRIPEIVSRLPDAQRTPQMLEGMIRSLALDPQEDCQSVLVKLAENDPYLLDDYQWRKSTMSIEGETAARRIVELVLSGKLKETSRSHMRLPEELARLLRDNPETHALVRDLLREGPQTVEQALLAHSLAECSTHEDVVLLVKCEVATKRSFLGPRTVEAAVTARVLSHEWQGVFSVIPVQSTQLRKELLALTVDGGKDDCAARCLTEIDKIRDMHGAPESEPRHPDLSSGRSWPILSPDPDAEGNE
ncbi:MAG: hypothetical protein F4X97_15815 [Boseongicola sp. SB0662_bin_57]|nr:hypothetical protein [Boseongicola sp. SB0662_bin_57]